jgi:aminoglycoside phosphotransferase (APT) family kinase protein
MKKYLSEVLSTLNELKRVINVSFLNKGYSLEKKYILTTEEGIKYLLRLSFPKDPNTKIIEMEKMLECIKLGVKCNEPIRYGLTSDKECFYSLLSWIEGNDGASCLKSIPTSKHLEIGLLAGKQLRLINSLEDKTSLDTWFNRFYKKQKLYYEIFQQSNIEFPYQDEVLSFINNNLDLIKNRPSFFQHDDFHLNNIIINNDTYAGVIDFNRWDYGDPWHEFVKLYMFSSEISKDFCNGQIKGYFYDKAIPKNFFTITALYTAFTLISGLVWSKRLVPHEYKQMQTRVKRIINDFDKFKLNKPIWLNI